MTKLLADGLIDRVLADGIDYAPDTSDNVYVLPADEWFLEAFAEDLRALIAFYGVSAEDEAFDCDDFAVMAVAHAHILHRLTPGHPKAGIAVGGLAYVTRRRTRHAIIAAVTPQHVLYMEPQTQERVMLTPQEKMSCYKFWF